MGILDTFQDFSLGTQADFRAEGQATGRAASTEGKKVKDQLVEIDYVESELQRWEETKELGPAGTFARDFRFGLTGPAPSFDENLEVTTGPEPFGSINEEGLEATERATVGGPDAEGNVPLVFWILGGLAAVIAVGQLFEVHVGNGGGT